MNIDPTTTWFSSFIANSNHQWIIERITTLIGFILIIWQVRRGYKNSQRLQLENKIMELKLKIYENILADITKAGYAVVEAATFFFSVRYPLMSTIGKKERDKYALLKNQNPLAFMVKHSDAKVAVGSLTKTISNYIILMTEMDIFVRIFDAQLERVGELQNIIFDAY